MAQTGKGGRKPSGWRNLAAIIPATEMRRKGRFVEATGLGRAST